MNDTDLANACVEHNDYFGVVDNRTGDGKIYYEIRRCEHGIWTCDVILEVSEFVHDWRVAGAMMEKCRERGYTFGFAVIGTERVEVEICDYNHTLREHDILGSAIGESLPRAIIEACCEALA